MDQYGALLFAAAILPCPASGLGTPDHVPPAADRQMRFLTFSSVHHDAKIVRALGAQMTTQETLALSSGCDKDERFPAAPSRAKLAWAVQHDGDRSVVLNVAIGSGYNVDAVVIRPTSYEH
ncbi:hypothetical protein RLPCCGM1_c2357 [Rhizobium leguminosarum bv. phaseoli CCGM1]|nr:hypothetical protein RHECNPAF_4300115 [Rhizobium etli CNPAF512]KEC74237.1 hypothetical protein RLPCCGM1_c2357 [Rhizobium leguminosarum bv. phaseoli CCGM1]PWI53114.1 hypothetical protein B5K03_17195 [Rhizobium phaseoli]